jgi:hypothetical protein
MVARYLSNTLLSSFRANVGGESNINAAITVIKDADKAFSFMPEATFSVVGTVLDIPCIRTRKGDYLMLQASGIEPLSGTSLPEPQVLDEMVVWESTNSPQRNELLLKQLMSVAAKPIEPPYLQTALDFRMVG